jgi:hypothetical protein
VRREFILPEADTAYLDGRSLRWEAVVDGGQRWLLVHDWPVPGGFNHTVVSAAVAMPPAYPDAALDMVYFFPALQRNDGKVIGGLSPHMILGQQWQRWSRHYSAANPWRIGEDDLSTHLTLIDHWLRRECSNGR